MWRSTECWFEICTDSWVYIVNQIMKLLSSLIFNELVDWILFCNNVKGTVSDAPWLRITLEKWKPVASGVSVVLMRFRACLPQSLSIINCFSLGNGSSPLLMHVRTRLVFDFIFILFFSFCRSVRLRSHFSPTLHDYLSLWKENENLVRSSQWKNDRWRWLAFFGTRTDFHFLQRCDAAYFCLQLRVADD